MSDAQLTYAARLTPSMAAAIATVAVRGPQAALKASAGLRTPLGTPLICDKKLARFALWRSALQPSMPEEHVVVLCRNSESLEIHCHGGLAITQLILSDLQAAGCTLIEAEQFAGMSVPAPLDSSDLSGPTDAELHALAELALMRARTLKVANVFLDQLSGVLASAFEELRTALNNGHSEVASIKCEQLIQHAAFGAKLIDPWRLTLAGPPNVGKSSLMNALLGTSRVVVHSDAGTTRDAVETSLVISGWPLTLTDTAGIRATSEEVERQGIAAALQRWSQADIGLIVVDVQVGWTIEHQRLLDAASPPVMFIVLNKADCVSDQQLSLIENSLPQVHRRVVNVVTASATQPNGVSDLICAIGRHIDNLHPPASTAIPFMPQHISWLKALRPNLA